MSEAPLETSGDAARAREISELGSRLREIREAKHITIEQTSKTTKIQKKYISAIEEGHLEVMPHGPYCRSFLRQYCAFLDAPDIWTRYDQLTQQPVPEETTEMPIPPRVFKRSTRIWLYLIVVLSIAAAVWIILRYRSDSSLLTTSPMEGGTASIAREQQKRRAEAEAQKKEAESAQSAQSATNEPQSPPAQPQTQQAQPQPAQQPTVAQSSVDLGWMDGKPPAAQTQAADQAQSQAQTPPSAKEAVMRISVRANSWLRVSVGQNVLYQQTMRPGESQEFRVEGETPIRIRCGNPAGTDIAWFGAPPAPMSGGSSPITRYYWSDGAVTESGTR